MKLVVTRKLFSLLAYFIFLIKFTETGTVLQGVLGVLIPRDDKLCICKSVDLKLDN